MICERFKTRLLDFALGAEDAALRSHIEACSSCRAELDAHRALVSSIDRGVSSMAAGEPSGDFAAQVRRRIAEQAAPHPWFAAWLPVTAAAALVLVAFVALLTIGRPPRPPQTMRVTPPATVAPTGKPREAVRTEAPPPVIADRRPSRGGAIGCQARARSARSSRGDGCGDAPLRRFLEWTSGRCIVDGCVDAHE